MNITAPITADSLKPDTTTDATARVSPESTGAPMFKLRGRPVPDSVMAKYREPIPPGRTPAWLTEFRKEILELKATGLTYVEIWDSLAKRYPFVPQFFEFTEPKDKTSRIAVFLARHPSRPSRRSSRGTTAELTETNETSETTATIEISGANND
jgi:hypothetical protein